MTARLIDGAAVAAGLRERVAAAAAVFDPRPCLAVILVGDDPASQIYVRSKAEKAEAAGLLSIVRRLPAGSSQGEVEAAIRALNDDPAVTGVLLQLPLPAGLDEAAAIARIHPDKDVDGLTLLSAGRVAQGQAGLQPCTPAGCVLLAKHALGGDLAGAHAVVIGRSILVGRPAALLFLQENCTISIAHSRTRDLPALCRTADILVPAVGRPGFVPGAWVKPGAVVIDVGINRIPAHDKGEGRTRVVGDADFASCSETAGWITPVPGGVGPMTVACLLRNTVLAAGLQQGRPAEALGL